MLLTIAELLNQLQDKITKVTAQEAKALLQQENSVLIDVREPAEYAEKSAKGAINIPRGVLEMKMLTLYPDEDKTIVIHCATSARASLAAEQLQRIGYKKVYVISCKLDSICECYNN
jgi:rhodanese-related sulfurtransferase